MKLTQHSPLLQDQAVEELARAHTHKVHNITYTDQTHNYDILFSY